VRSTARAFAVAALLFASPALAWGPQGHEIVAQIAADQLAGSPVATVVHKILHGLEMHQVASWADEVRDVGRGKGNAAAKSDPLARALLQIYPDSQHWHFVDLPLGASGYDPLARYNSESREDAVKAIGHCVQVLESPRDKPGEMTREMALRFLIHLVGDLHQPLHAESARYSLAADTPAVQFDPDVDLGFPSDRGGNEVAYGGEFQELHSLWDGVMVRAAVGQGTRYDQAAKVLAERFAAAAKKWVPAGDHHGWAQQWVVESNRVATAVYKKIHFTGGKDVERSNQVHMRFEKPEDYEDAHQAIAAEQLAKGGFRLAALLRAIKWPK
jgi:hypothetical protein